MIKKRENVEPKLPVIQIPIKTSVSGAVVGYLTIDSDNFLFGKIESEEFSDGIRRLLENGYCDSIQIRMNPAPVTELKTEPLPEGLAEQQLEVYRNLHQNH